MRIGINLFIALMIASVGGVIYQRIIEMPVELYYDAQVEHTASNYSYKPGQSGTEYRFYVKNQERGFREVNFFASIGIPMLFYFSCLTIIGLLRWMIRRNKPIKEIPKNKFDEKTYERLVKFRTAARKRNPTLTVVLIIFIGLFFYSGRNNLFGLGMGEESDAVSVGIEASFNPTHLVYSANGKGSGNIWLIREDKSGEGAVYIDEERTTSFDSIIYSVSLIKQKNDKRFKVDDFVVSDDKNSFDPFYSNGKIWLTARPDMMRVYDARTKEIVYGSTDDFSKHYSELQSGIFNYYRHDWNGTTLLRIECLDGGQYYYHFDTDTLVENLSELTHPGMFQRFGLKRGNGERFKLTVRTPSDPIVEEIFSEDRDLLAALQAADIRLDRHYAFERIVEDKFFISPQLIGQTYKYAFIMHQEDVRAESPRMISALDSSATLIWSVDSKKFPNKVKDEFMPGIRTATAEVDGNTLVVYFMQDWEACGMMGINIESGKVEWNYNYSDLSK